MATIVTSIGIMEPLKHALICYLKGLSPIEVSRQHVKEVGVIESQVDKLGWDLKTTYRGFIYAKNNHPTMNTRSFLFERTFFLSISLQIP